MGPLKVLILLDKGGEGMLCNKHPYKSTHNNTP